MKTSYAIRNIKTSLLLPILYAIQHVFCRYVKIIGEDDMGYGQFGMGQGMIWNDYCLLPDMTDEQAEQIKELRLAHYKEVQPLRGQMSELAIKHRNLIRAGNVDAKAINASIDEKTNVMNKLMKKQAEFRVEFRNLLTDEQKMLLDNSGRGFGMRKGMRNSGRRGRSFRGGGFNRW